MVHTKQTDIESARKSKGYTTQLDFAEAAGITLRYYHKIRNGEVNSPDPSILHKLARLVGADAHELFPAYFQVPKVPVLGEVGAGQQVFPVDDLPIISPKRMSEKDWGELNCEVVDAPPGAHYNVAAVKVKGDSMEPAYENGTLLYYTRRADSPEECIGKRAICQIKDGPMLVKKVYKGSEYGKYNLESLNARKLENVEIEWCARVTWTKEP